MATSQSSGFARSLDWYDGIAGVVVILVLGVAFLLLMQPILGLCVAAAFLSAYEAYRRDTARHAAVVAGLWAVFLGTWWLLDPTQIVATGVLALAAYVGWRVSR
jgi:hypothetical protein